MVMETINLTVTGQVGLNLQAAGKGVGAFVDSFYRGIDPESGVELMLPAESTFGIKLLGSIIYTVNGLDVSESPAVDICKIISNADRPLQLSFIQHDQDLEDSSIVFNHDSLPWLLEHLEELERENSAKSDDSVLLLRGKLLCYLDCERVLSNLNLLKLDQRHKLPTFLMSLMSPFPELNFPTSISECEQNLNEITSILRKDLKDDLVPSFIKSVAMRRMKGYNFRSLKQGAFTFFDILSNKAALFHFFIHLSRPHRRHLHLLCYLRMTDVDQQVSTFEMLILCASAFELCMESSLQPLKYRMDRIVDVLRAARLSSHDSTWENNSRQLITGVPEAKAISECYGNLRKLLSEITDSLVWDYVVGIYPSFQASKDYAPLNLNLSTSSTINSNFESINDLLRNKKLPNSLTVHRREIIITDSSHNKMKGSACIAMFDTYTDRAARNDKTGNDELIMAQIAEDECALLKTQVKGHIEKLNITANIDADERWSADSEICSMLKALSPFFVPTGKTSILAKTSHEGHYPPAPKLFSMVLSVRDQPQIYACSLVMYRRVELIKSLELNTMGNAKITSFNTTPGATELKERTSSAGLQTKLKGFRTKPTFSNDYAGSRMSNVTENQDLKNVPSPLDLASCQLSESTASIESTHFGIQTELSLPQSDLVTVSNVTAGSLDTDTVFISQASVNSTLSIDSPTGFYRPNILINFSDDESAGLISSAILDLPPTPKICHLDSEMGAKSLQATVVQRHGSFTEFLAATATATVSAASAIALQAGVLPKPTFSWTPSGSNMSQAIKPSDSKGFYDNLYLSRFSMMKFANSQPQQQTGTNSESGLKRKYDGFNFTETILFGEEKVVALDEGLNYQATSSESLSSSIYSESSVPLIISGRDSTPSARGSDYSPDKPSLSSYPKFGHVKLLKRSILLPHSPSRSPRHRNSIRAQVKRSRAASFTTIPRLEASSLDYSSKRMAFDSVVTDGENTIHKNATDNSLELEILADLSNLHLAPDSSVPIEEKYKTADLSSAKISHGTIGVGYMAHGICLFTQDPAVGKLRDAAAAIASDIHHLSILVDDSSAAPTLSESIKATVINSLRKFADAEVIASSSSSSRYGEQAKDYNSKLILDALSPKNLVTVLVAFLLEYRIVVVSSRSLSAATHLGEFLKEAIYPLKYSHVYSPLVPPSIGLQLIHCPAPFFIGMKRSSAIDEVIELEDERDREKNIGRRNRNASGRDHGCGLLVVDMDRDECSLPQDLCAPVRAAKVLIRALESLLHPELSNCDEITKVSGRQHDLRSSDTLIMRVLDLCGQFVTSTLQGLESCCLKVDEGQERIVLFDELMFLQQHINRCTLQSPAISKIFKVLDGQTLSTDRLETKKDESAVPNELNRDGLSDKNNILPYDASLSASSCRDVEKLIRSLMRTQSFSLYLTA